jgi:hypothetical protein
MYNVYLNMQISITVLIVFLSVFTFPCFSTVSTLAFLNILYVLMTILDYSIVAYLRG